MIFEKKKKKKKKRKETKTKTKTKKKLFGHEIYVLIFSTNFVQNISHSRKNSERYYRNAHISSCKVPVILVRFQTEFNFLDRFVEEFLNIKSHETLSSGSRVVPCGRTDRHGGANSRFS
jgi:hypothetical protein